MNEHCNQCGTHYVTGRDADGNPWRALCSCERTQMCARGRHYATHARELDDTLTFSCDKHGVSLDDRSESAVLPPEPVRERGQRKKEKTSEEPKKPRAPPKSQEGITLTPELLADIYSTDRREVRCECGDVHIRSSRIWRQSDWVDCKSPSMFNRGFYSHANHCPACDRPDRDPETFDTTWKFLVEEPPNPAPTPAPKRKSK